MVWASGERERLLCSYLAPASAATANLAEGARRIVPAACGLHAKQKTQDTRAKGLTIRLQHLAHLVLKERLLKAAGCHYGVAVYKRPTAYRLPASGITTRGDPEIRIAARKPLRANDKSILFRQQQE